MSLCTGFRKNFKNKLKIGKHRSYSRDYSCKFLGHGYKKWANEKYLFLGLLGQIRTDATVVMGAKWIFDPQRSTTRLYTLSSSYLELKMKQAKQLTEL